ncbi:hypothetical protein HPB47_022433 [Ixodes persulcatus]|uniref:Uncharacterized protein n=1 Tax=Ixodes persulcatus TaxID=34615 RepID=A0AC60QD31_IXOPE|nr:hypothetical protein HPB47_022433 [Ixodes persulcatus]
MERLSVYVDSKLLRRPGREKLLHSVKNTKRTRTIKKLQSAELRVLQADKTGRFVILNKEQIWEKTDEALKKNSLPLKSRPSGSLRSKTACSTLKKLSQPCDQETQVTFHKFKRHLPYVAAHPTKLRDPRQDLLIHIAMRMVECPQLDGSTLLGISEASFLGKETGEGAELRLHSSSRRFLGRGFMSGCHRRQGASSSPSPQRRRHAMSSSAAVDQDGGSHPPAAWTRPQASNTWNPVADPSCGSVPTTSSSHPVTDPVTVPVPHGASPGRDAQPSTFPRFREHFVVK